MMIILPFNPKSMIDGDYILQFGKYKSLALRTVPNGYLVALYTSDALVNHPEVKEYIEVTIPFLLPKNKSIIIPDPICSKVCYVDKESAKKALKLIKQDKRIHKKPVRAYKHEDCGYWHLTSQPKLNEEE